MNKIIIISLVCVAVAVGFVAALTLSGVGITLTIGNQGSQDTPNSNPVTTHTGSIQTPIPSVDYDTKTKTPVSQPTANPTTNDNGEIVTVIGNQNTQHTSLQTEGIEKLVGNWHGTQSMMFVANGEFNAACYDDFNAVFSGKISALGQNYDFVLPLNWYYLGNNQFEAVAPDNTIIYFTCDGSKLHLVVNPYKYNLVDNSMADMDFSIDLYRV